MDISIYQTPMGQIQVWLTEKRGPDGGRRYVAQPVELVMRELNEAEEIPPTITMGMMDGREFIDALVRYVREKKLDKQSEDRVVGELDATKRHLEDMRTLVFDKSEIVVSGVSDGELPKR